MLVLSRYRDESIYIGDDVVITVVDIRGDRVRIGVQAPPDVSVHRQEIYEAIKNGATKEPVQREQREVGAPPLSHELSKRKAKMASEAKSLPVGIDTTIEYGGLTPDSAVMS